jgi:SAM-dependent methyltransferase
MRRDRGVHNVAVVQNEITQNTPSGGSAAWARVFALPYETSVDTVVSTFVLCAVDAPDLALREIARVLRPDGQRRAR